MLGRKILRLILLFIPLLYFYFSKRLVLSIITGFLSISILFEIIRFMDSSFKKKLNRKLSWILKPEEENRITGITFLFLSFFVVLNYYQKNIAILALTIAILYDFFSYFGKIFGKIRIKGRTLEGAFLGALVSFVVARYLGPILGLGNNVLISAVLAAPLIELFLSWPNDNFTVPFFVAFVAQFVKNSF